MSHVLKIVGFVFGLVLSAQAAIDAVQEEFTLVSGKLSRGEEVILASGRITYFQTRQSLDTQWADMILVDDPTGLRKCMEKLEYCRPVTEPYFFNLSKGGVSFDILGSCHFLPLEALPPFIAQKFERHSILVNEGRYPDSHEEEKDGEKSYCPSSFSWVDRLTPQEWKHLSSLPELEIPDPVRIDVRVALDAYEQLHFRGMDDDLTRLFMRAKKTIKKLEEGLCDLGRETLEDEEKSLSSFKSQLQWSLEHGGYLNTPHIISRGFEYLLGKIMGTGLLEDAYVDQENQRWFSQLKDTVQNGTGVVVGLNHLLTYSDSKGILSYFSEDGWTVERYDRHGNLNPHPAPK